MEARFLTKVIKCENGCWEWTGCKRSKRSGYGALKVNGKMYPAHRLAYQLWNGEIPVGMVVRHKCDNPPCVNPEHLEIGSYKDNTNDMMARGRASVGEKQGCSKLTEDDVREIRILRGFGFTLKELGKMYAVHFATIAYSMNGKNWKHIKV